MAQPEKLEQAAIVKLLRMVGASVYVLGTRRARGDYQGTRQTPGLPDLIAFVPDHSRTFVDQNRTLLMVEVKAPNGRPSDPQVEFCAHCQAAHVAHVMGGVDAVLDWLTTRGMVTVRTGGRV